MHHWAPLNTNVANIDKYLDIYRCQLKNVDFANIITGWFVVPNKRKSLFDNKEEDHMSPQLFMQELFLNFSKPHEL